MKSNFIAITIVIFLVLSAIFYALKINAPEFNYAILMAGNAVMAFLCIVSYVIVTKQISNRPDAFVRGVYASSFLKLFVCMISILVYAMVNKPHVHKPSIFVLLGIYAV
jgi:nitrogen fixation/metabolism regulation signal transduction histidine kinase